MRRFDVEFGSYNYEHRVTVVWCLGERCEKCKARYLCYTLPKDEAFVIKNNWNYEFIGQSVHYVQGKHPNGAQLGMNVNTLVEYFLFGEEALEVPEDMWSRGWVFQGFCWWDHPRKCSECEHLVKCQDKSNRGGSGRLTIHRGSNDTY